MLSGFDKGDFIESRNEQYAQHNILWKHNALTSLKYLYFQGTEVWILKNFAVTGAESLCMLWNWHQIMLMVVIFVKNTQASEM